MTTSETLQAIFSGVVALSTVVYSVLTWRLVTETKRMRMFQNTPDVNVYFERAEAEPSFIYVVFKNTGLGYAQNVKFKIIKDFNYYHKEHFQLKEKGIIKHGIDSFYSNQSYRFFFTNLKDNYQEKIGERLQIKITYRDLNNKTYTKTSELSLAELAGIMIINPPDHYIGRITHELGELRKLISSWIDREKRLDKEEE